MGEMAESNTVMIMIMMVALVAILFSSNLFGSAPAPRPNTITERIIERETVDRHPNEMEGIPKLYPRICAGNGGTKMDAFGNMLNMDDCHGAKPARCLPVAYNYKEFEGGFWRNPPYPPTCKVHKAQKYNHDVTKMTVRARRDNNVDQPTNYASTYRSARPCPSGFQAKDMAVSGNNKDNAIIHPHVCWRDPAGCPVDMIMYPKTGASLYITLEKTDNDILTEALQEWSDGVHGVNDDIVGVVCQENHFIRFGINDRQCGEQFAIELRKDDTCRAVYKDEVECKDGSSMRYVSHATGNTRVLFGRVKIPMHHGDRMRACEAKDGSYRRILSKRP